MDLFRMLLIAVISLFAIACALSRFEMRLDNVHFTPTNLDQFHHGRFLRSFVPAISPESNLDNYADEKRLLSQPRLRDAAKTALSSLKKKIFSWIKLFLSWLSAKVDEYIPMGIKTTYWLDNNKNPGYVEAAMGLDTVPLGEREKHPLTPVFEKYTKAYEKKFVMRVIRENISTYSFWRWLKLDQIVNTTDDMPEAELIAALQKIQETKGFKLYEKYALEYDKLKSMSDCFDKKATRLEKFARALIWATSYQRRSNVRTFLNLRAFQGENNELYQFFKRMKRARLEESASVEYNVKISKNRANVGEMVHVVVTLCSHDDFTTKEACISNETKQQNKK
ncbi:hypothetical protein CCR75_000196 [Bremia lactucae]|uniref:RxLR effector protein n=1 Tax=Bremia lactucae TaxID=4779 RepID=A0A976FNR4_BRELC|nr:hypothetical protein CCR75_000196 [Bremia lactucae]